METRRQVSLGVDVATWRRALRAGTDMRADEVDDSYDHFCELVTAQMRRHPALL